MARPYYRDYPSLVEAEKHLFTKGFNLNREETQKAGQNIYVYTSETHRAELREVNGEVKCKRVKLEDYVPSK